MLVIFFVQNIKYGPANVINNVVNNVNHATVKAYKKHIRARHHMTYQPLVTFMQSLEWCYKMNLYTNIKWVLKSCKLETYGTYTIHVIMTWDPYKMKFYIWLIYKDMMCTIAQGAYQNLQLSLGNWRVFLFLRKTRAQRLFGTYSSAHNSWREPLESDSGADKAYWPLVRK